MRINTDNMYFPPTPKINKENCKMKCHISLQEDGQLTVYLGMREKGDFRHYLDVSKVKESIKIFNDNPSLRGRESFSVTIDRKGGVIEKPRKKYGRTKAF